jgi:hypothetical protein
MRVSVEVTVGSLSLCPHPATIKFGTSVGSIESKENKGLCQATIQFQATFR